MNTCLFCRSSINSFLSIEHIFPESLGNKEKILQKGIVCDRCNNGDLAKLDEELLEFEPIKLLRTVYGIENKRGRVPISTFNNVQVENPTKHHLSINIQSRKNVSSQTNKGFQLNFRGNKKMDSARLKRLARSLYKIGLELICVDHGIDFALSKKFDEIRDIILGKKDFNGYLMVGESSNPTTAGMRYQPFKDETGLEFFVFEFQYLFVYIIFDMQRRNVLLGNGDKLKGFNILKF